GSLSDLVEHYEEVLGNPRLVLIAEADGFRDTHRLLSQYVLLQSRYPGSELPPAPYEAFANPSEVIIEERPLSVEIDSLNPPLIDLNPASPEPPPAPVPPSVLPPPSVLAPPAVLVPPAEPMPPADVEIQDLPAPVGEPAPQP